MDDTKRAGIMLILTNGIALGVSFGLGLDGEQVGAISAFGNSILIGIGYFWKHGQEPDPALPGPPPPL